MAIRYDKKFNSEIARAVKNYNAKINRLQAKGLADLPEKVSVQAIKDAYFTRRDLRYRLKQLKAFSVRGSEQLVTTKSGITTLKYNIDIYKQDLRRTRYYYSRQLHMLEKTTPTVLGKQQFRTLAEMGDETVSNLRAKLNKLSKFNFASSNMKDFREARNFLKIQIMQIAKRNQIFFDNYFDIIEKTAFMAGIDPKKINALKDKLSRLNPNMFYKMYKQEKAFSSLIDYYMIQKMESGVVSDEDSENIEYIVDNLLMTIDQLEMQYKI